MAAQFLGEAAPTRRGAAAPRARRKARSAARSAVESPGVRPQRGDAAMPSIGEAAARSPALRSRAYAKPGEKRGGFAESVSVVMVLQLGVGWLIVCFSNNPAPGLPLKAIIPRGRGASPAAHASTSGSRLSPRIDGLKAHGRRRWGARRRVCCSDQAIGQVERMIATIIGMAAAAAAVPDRVSRRFWRVRDDTPGPSSAPGGLSSRSFRRVTRRR